MAEEQSAHQTVAASEQNGNGAAPSARDGSVKENRKIQMAKRPFPMPPLPLGYEEITKILPHRYPLLLVDRILEIEPGHRCIGIKNVTFNEEYFQGHFPGLPVMPGVLILEAMAQVAGLLTLVSRNTPGALSYFAAIENARFRQPVAPGDQLVTEAVLQVLRGTLCKVKVTGRVDGQIVVEADYTFYTTVSADAETIVQTAGIAATGEAAKAEVVIPPRLGTGPTYIHPTALVDKNAQLAESVWIGPHCVVEAGTSIGANTVLETNVIVKKGTHIGARCRLWPNVVLGHEPQDMKFHSEESFVYIGDDNMLREMVTIHRATGEGEATRIGNSNLLMAYVHVGHNCTIGDNTMISNSAGISGHVTIEDKVVIGGFAGIHQFVHIGKMGMVGGLSKVVQDVPPFCICDGRPAKVHGLNVRGLRRNGVPTEERNQVGNAFKLLYRSGLNTSQALERIHAEVPRSATLDYFISFVERVREGRLGRQDETPHF